MDWGMIGGLAGPIGSIVGAGIDMLTQSHANKANAENVDKQIAFQKDQAATQYQRGTADMEKAGLNPALAYQQGGAQAMSGAAATAQPTTSNTGDKIATALNAYNTLATGTAQRDLLREQAASTAADARLKILQGTVLAPQAFAGQDPQYNETWKRTKMAEMTGAQFTAGTLPARFNAEMGNVGASTAQAQASANLMRSSTTLNEQQFQNAWFRKNVAPYLNSTAAAIKPFQLTANMLNP